jgi:hypothetical protein
MLAIVELQTYDLTVHWRTGHAYSLIFDEKSMKDIHSLLEFLFLDSS